MMISNPVTASDVNRAYQAGLRYLSVRDHSVQEVRKKLRRRRMNSEAIEEALEKLQEDTYLDDERTALSYGRRLAEHRLAGPVFTTMRLQEKGIPHQVIKKVIDQIYTENPPEELALKLIRKHFTNGENPTVNNLRIELSKIGRYLANHGYSKKYVQVILERLPKPREPQRPRDPQKPHHFNFNREFNHRDY